MGIRALTAAITSTQTLIASLRLVIGFSGLIEPDLRLDGFCQLGFFCRVARSAARRAVFTASENRPASA